MENKKSPRVTLRVMKLLQRISDSDLERESIEKMQIIAEGAFAPSLQIVYTCGKAELYKNDEAEDKLTQILNKR